MKADHFDVNFCLLFDHLVSQSNLYIMKVDHFNVSSRLLFDHLVSQTKWVICVL